MAMVSPECYYRTNLETELERYYQIQEDAIDEIQNWLSTQPHLPHVFEVQIAHFLHASYYDVEAAKNCIEHYFTYKNSMAEFFTDWDPLSKNTVEYINRVLFAAFLPKKTPKDCQIVLLKLNDTSLDLYDFHMSVKWLLMSVTSLIIQDGMQTEFKIVYDANGFTMSHVMRNPFSSVKHYLEFGQKASAIRVVEIHFINSNSVVKKLISMVKPFMNKHIMKMISFHTSSEGFFKTLPKEQVPSDYGGSGPSVETLHAENLRRVESVRDALIEHNRQKTDESKRIDKKKKVHVEENFRKLEID